MTRRAKPAESVENDPKQTSLLRSKDAPLDHVIRVAAGAILGINSGQPIAPAAACQSELFVSRIRNLGMH
jgi:hypothetical protein